ncbi:VOC family protein [Streptomyces tauricus]|uniref:VOC family protein n=1 Tax=Streptomyces tauricus TaxID=68274 RepID=UPI00339DF6DA
MMDLRLQHVNVCSDDMEELHRFYSEVLGLKMGPLPPMINHEGHEEDESQEDGTWRQNVAFFDAGEGGQDVLQIHASRRQAYLGPRMGHSINPLLTGHFAFRTDNLAEVREHLNKHNVPFADYGEWAVKGWDQIFLTDPAGNVIEIHQVMD